MNERVLVSKEVAEFIEGYEENVASYNGWENDLLVQHSQAWINGFEGCNEEALCMKEIEPIELAAMLLDGFEIESYDEGCLD